MLVTIAQSPLDPDLAALALLAASIGVVHTLTGPDHYLPFVAMSRIGRWSYRRTMLISFACGIGHVGSSVVLGTLGIAAGLAVAGLERFEGLRGNFAAWLLFGFGLAYAAWGFKRAARGVRHTHWHTHEDGTVHRHGHNHTHDHAHAHGEQSMTPWVLFTIFVFGPCEPLIPVLMYPAAKLNVIGVLLVAGVFGVATIGTMLAVISAGYFGLTKIAPTPLARYSHAAAGLTLALCGALMLIGL